LALILSYQALTAALPKSADSKSLCSSISLARNVFSLPRATEDNGAGLWRILEGIPFYSIDAKRAKCALQYSVSLLLPCAPIKLFFLPKKREYWVNIISTFDIIPINFNTLV